MGANIAIAIVDDDELRDRDQSLPSAAMRRKQVTEVDPTEKFCTTSIRYAVDDLRAIIGRIDMNTERPLAKRQAISPKQPFDSASLGREAHRVTAAALEAHMQHTMTRMPVRVSDRGSHNSDAWTH